MRNTSQFSVENPYETGTFSNVGAPIHVHPYGVVRYAF
jgi:hypothetical protein